VSCSNNLNFPSSNGFGRSYFTEIVQKYHFRRAISAFIYDFVNLLCIKMLYHKGHAFCYYNNNVKYGVSYVKFD